MKNLLVVSQIQYPHKIFDFIILEENYIFKRLKKYALIISFRHYMAQQCKVQVTRL